MEYQKIINLSYQPNQRTKFRAKTWVEINDVSYGMCFIWNVFH